MLDLTVKLGKNTIKALEELVPGYRYGDMDTPEMMLSDMVERYVWEMIRDEQFYQGKINEDEYIEGRRLTLGQWQQEREKEGDA